MVSASRLTRLAAQATGNATPAAVWRTLAILDTDGPLRVGELASASRVSQPGMTRLLGGMSEDGLVSRDADADDSRASIIAITPAGRRAIADWGRLIGETLEPWFRDLDEDDWAALERTVAIVADRTAAGIASPDASTTGTSTARAAVTA